MGEKLGKEESTKQKRETVTRELSERKHKKGTVTGDDSWRRDRRFGFFREKAEKRV